MKSEDEQFNPPAPAADTADPTATAQPLAGSNGENTKEPRLDTIADASGKRSVSRRKLEANRRNSRKSTGPRTSAGKKRVSRNATKHGFFSQVLLVPEGKESQAEYNELHLAISKYYQPMGWLEQHWVEIIAVWSWRLRRVIRHESGQIARALAEHMDNLQQLRAADADEPGAGASSSSPLDAMTDHLFLNPDGLEEQMRYEAMINRQLNQAIAQLERLQAGRNGENAAI
jgi:hypothetical protein